MKPLAVVLKWIALLGGTLALLAGTFLLGYCTGDRGDATTGGHASVSMPDRAPAAAPPRAPVWTCSMHPQIRQPEPGQCPICGMALVLARDPAATKPEGGPMPEPGKKYACAMLCVPPRDEPGKCPVCGMELVEVGGNGGAGGERRIAISETARRLAEIQTAPVERKFVAADIRMVGKVDFDETTKRTISAWVPGRLDRLFADYTGVRVQAGDEMVRLFSPELISAQEALLQALGSMAEVERSGLATIRETTRSTVAAARARLRNLGLAAEQVADLERAGHPSDHVILRAPISGVVVHKNVKEGMYVQTGTPLYTIADLSIVWVKLDAYESDLAWIRYGQEVTFTTEAVAGRAFTGRIAFIDPVLDDRTRTVKVRANVPNPDGLLKPDMFVRGRVQSRIAADGKVMDAALAGKWISPRHPEIVKDEPGMCDKCGIALVRAEDLGYVAVDPDRARPPLVIPDSAPLITGKRAVVYVEVEAGVFEGREVVLGPRAGDQYLVLAGLAEGERVAVNGAFKIDSAVQIRAGPSMMNPPGEEKPTAAGGPQTHCPVMGGAIVRDVFLDHEGKRIYFCCPPCIDKFKAAPEKYLAALRAAGVVLEDAPR
ncbi:MAG: efflux RND transporter periplasmic adaptor subunit [Planctomycetes bacterium]|nr:efflux RND transporter periplasmic adaptor subunit [Planctomycetota bacterium]